MFIPFSKSFRRELSMSHRNRLGLLFGLVILTLNPAPAQVKPDGRRAWNHVDYLASDAFKGRKSGTPEYRLAAHYVADKMKEYGLQPAGEKSGYFQEVLFKKWKNFDPPTRLEVHEPSRIDLIPGRGADFIPLGGTGSGISRGRLAFAGYGLRSKSPNWDDYADINVEGRIVLLIPGAPKFLEGLKKRETTPEAKIKTALKLGAAGVLFMNVGEGFGGRRAPAAAKKGVCPENFTVMSVYEKALDRIFYSSGISWRDWVSRMLREQKTHSRYLDIAVEMETHYIEEDRRAPNVLGMFPGRDPELKDEYIILGGHLDHLGTGVDGFVYNGADDNASSVGVLLELARVLHANDFQPARTVVFAAWAGEELGLVGSRWYVKHPLFPLKRTVIYMNMDMVGTGDEDLFVGGMWEFSDCFDILKEALPERLRDRLRYRIDYRGSDHSAFLPSGVTCISLRSGNPLTRELDDEHPEYHRPGDIHATILPERLEEAAEYHGALLQVLAETRENLLDPVYHQRYLHKSSFVVDLHCDTIGRQLRGVDLSLDNERGHIDIPKLKQGAVDLQIFACYVGPPRDEAHKHQAAKTVFDQIDGVHELVENNPDDMLLITSPNQLRNLRGTRKIGALIGIEGGYAIENDLRLLRSFYRNGVRLMTLTHWLRTDWADASGDPEPLHGGLTEFGEDVVREMNRLGMIIDVSHVHDETFWDVIRLSEDPVVASHSCCRALSDHHRNLSDKMLKALAKNNGMVGINFMPGFLNADNQKRLDSLREELLRKNGLPEDRELFRKADTEVKLKFSRELRQRREALRAELPPVNIATVVDHIEHVVKVTGNSNHVGLGSDFDGISSTPEGLEHAGLLPELTAEMARRGFKDKDITKILGGNFIRIFRKVSAKKD